MSSHSIKNIEVDKSETQEPVTGQLSQSGAVEPNPLHAREIAERTLHDALEYLVYLEALSRECGNSILPVNVINRFDTEFNQLFVNLIDAISTFTEALTCVKQILRIGILQPVNILEADLLSILKDILSGKQNEEKSYLKDLLTIHLPKNLEQWRTTGIPAIIRSRDS